MAGLALGNAGFLKPFTGAGITVTATAVHTGIGMVAARPFSMDIRVGHFLFGECGLWVGYAFTGENVGAVGIGEASHFFQPWTRVVVNEKVFKECPVVVIVVAACAGTTIKGQIPMALPVVADVGVTVETIILWQGYSHRGCNFFAVLGVTADTVAGINHTEPVCIARVGKLLFGVRIVGLCQLRTMAADTGFLNEFGTTKGLCMATATGQFDLEVPMAGLADQ